MVLRDNGPVDLSAEEWLALQRQARTEAGLALFRGSVMLSDFVQTDEAALNNKLSEVLLDTEVIAIYW